MGYTTSIPEPELERGDGNPPCEGVDAEAALKAPRLGGDEEKKTVTKSKVVEGEKDDAPKKSTAKTKDK